MDNAQKAIMIGVGLFITIIIISAVLLVVNLGTGLMNDATGELGSMSASLRAQILDNYDGKTKTGSEILAAVRQYQSSNSVAMRIGGTTYVGAGKIDGGTGTVGNVGGITGATLDTTATTSSYAEVIAAGTISSSAYYKTSVVYDTYSNIIGIDVVIVP